MKILSLRKNQKLLQKNKYQEALNFIFGYALDGSLNNSESNMVREKVDILQKLVNKETPIKPKKIEEFITFNGIPYKIAKCPNCKGNNKVREYVSGNRCYTCGQKLDWSDEDE